MNAFERKKTYKEVRYEILDGHFAGYIYSVLLEQCGSTRKRVNQLRSVDRALSRIHVLVLNDL